MSCCLDIAEEFWRPSFSFMGESLEFVSKTWFRITLKLPRLPFFENIIRTRERITLAVEAVLAWICIFPKGKWLALGRR